MGTSRGVLIGWAALGAGGCAVDLRRGRSAQRRAGPARHDVIAGSRCDGSGPGVPPQRAASPYLMDCRNLRGTQLASAMERGSHPSQSVGTVANPATDFPSTPRAMDTTGHFACHPIADCR